MKLFWIFLEYDRRQPGSSGNVWNGRKKTLLRSSWRNSEKVAQWASPKFVNTPSTSPWEVRYCTWQPFFCCFFFVQINNYTRMKFGARAGCPSHRAGFQLLRMHFGAPVGLECESFWYKPTKKQCFSIVMLVLRVVTMRLCFFYINRNKFKLRLWKIQGEAICLFHNLMSPKRQGHFFPLPSWALSDTYSMYLDVSIISIPACFGMLAMNLTPTMDTLLSEMRQEQNPWNLISVVLEPGWKDVQLHSGRVLLQHFALHFLGFQGTLDQAHCHIFRGFASWVDKHVVAFWSKI